MQNREKEFRDAFEKHSDELFRHCLLRLSDRERAAELAQECFLRSWEYLVKGGVIGQYRPFLYRVLNNLIIDEYRRHKTQSLDALLENEETAVSVEGELLRDTTDIFEETAIKLDLEQALAMIEQLPDTYKSVIVMRYVDGLLPSEIASCLNESENNVSVRIHRGMRKLRELLTSSHDIKP